MVILPIELNSNIPKPEPGNKVSTRGSYQWHDTHNYFEGEDIVVEGPIHNVVDNIPI